MPERKPRHFVQWTSEEQQRAFMVWLPPELHDAPGLDWSRLPDSVMGYCVTSIGSTLDAPYLALAAASAQGALSASSLYQLLEHLHTLFTILRIVCDMEHVSNLSQEELWDELAAKTQATRTRSRQLSSYSAVSTKHFPTYLRTLTGDDYAHMRQYQLPPLPDGFLKYVGRAGELNARSMLRQQPIHATLVPLFPALRQLAWQRKKVAERLLQAYHQARRQAAAGAMIPLTFQYTDVLPWLTQQGELHMRELHLRFILWTKRDWILEHTERYSTRVIEKAENREGIYAPHRDRFFVQFDGPPAELLWFGILVDQRLMQNLHAGLPHDPLYSLRVHLAEALDFSHGCCTSQSGLLQPDVGLALWFARHSRPGDALFEPEALYRGILHGAALAMLALTNGGSVSELLQVSDERWMVTAEGRQQRLLPERARNDNERRSFMIDPLASELLAEIERGLVKAYGEIPVVAATRQTSKFEQLQAERYLFQWRGGMLLPRDTEVLVRFLLHGVNLKTTEGTPIRMTMEQLRYGGNFSAAERAQELLDVFGFNQTILPHLSPSSRAAYGRDFYAYWQFAGTKEAAFQPGTLERWRTYLVALRYERGTINRKMSAVQRIFAAAAAQGFIDQQRGAALQGVAKVPAEKPEVTVLHEHAVKQAIEKKSGRSDKQIMEEDEHWIAEQCLREPGITARELRERLAGERGKTVSKQRLNRIRAHLGLRRPSDSPPRVPPRRPTSYKLGDADISWLLQQKREHMGLSSYKLEVALKQQRGKELSAHQINRILRRHGLSRR